MKELIKIENLRKVYQTNEIETTALQGVSMSVTQGDFVAIMGPSGCGKSTLLNILGFIDEPDAGSYTYNGQILQNLKEGKKADFRKANLGFVFQSFSLINELNVYDNVELPLIYTKLSSKERKNRITNVLSQLNIIHRAQHYPTQLSGGQQQRVAIARAIVNKPAVILADEPTGNLDSQNSKEVMKTLSILNARGSTIIMVTHSMHDAAYANKKIHLFDGEIIKEDTLKKLSHV
jgi:putative ABC transport system ATP-binding protein